MSSLPVHNTCIEKMNTVEFIFFWTIWMLKKRFWTKSSKKKFKKSNAVEEIFWDQKSKNFLNFFACPTSLCPVFFCCCLQMQLFQIKSFLWCQDKCIIYAKNIEQFLIKPVSFESSHRDGSIGAGFIKIKYILRTLWAKWNLYILKILIRCE